MPIIQTHILQVSSEDDQLRLDIYLARHIPGELSRTFVKRLIDSGQVKVNDQPVKAHYKVSLRDHICVQMAQLPRDNRLAAEDIDLQVFYEDEYMMVVNKPAGMLVHPAGNRVSGTLVNALLNHCDKLSDVNTDVRPGIVHRLDEETSGLILIAKDNKTHIRLSRHFEKHKIRKRYLALVE
ncbi:MAG: RluA family pseudouridine synthase, partial [Candidatus Omnitrophota bacterium]